jgi:predicted DNA-binding protein
MAKCKKIPRYNVVSVRVSDEERELLEKLSRESNKKVSDLIREAMHDIVPQRMSA